MAARPQSPGLETFFEQVNQQVNLVEFLGQYTKLEKKGSSWMGCCPLHAEKSASFSVSEDRGLWYCFGCGKGGNLFTFLKEKEGLEFIEAARLIAERYRIPLPERGAPGEGRSQKETLRAMHEAAAAFYHQNLLAERGRPFQQYLKERAFSRQDAEVFRLGAAFEEWEGLTTHLQTQGFSRDELLTAGLASQSRQGPGVVDRFRGRLMIPIADPLHRPIAFAGRIVGEGEPKYLNSPESPLFHKGETLFALDHARTEIKRRGLAVVMEGYTDVMRAHQCGAKYAVAAMGTALTPNQIAQLRKFAEQVILVLDADAAGQNATEKHVFALLAERMDVRVVTLAEGKDPDDFLRAQGLGPFEAALAEAKGGLDFLLARRLPREIPRELHPKIELIRTLAEVLEALPTQAERRDTVLRFSEQIAMREADALEAAAPWLERGTQPSAPRPSAPAPAGPTHGSPTRERERALIAAMIRDADCRRLGLDALVPEDFAHRDPQRLIALLQSPEVPRETEALEALPIWQQYPELQRMIVQVLATASEPVEPQYFQMLLAKTRADRVAGEMAGLRGELEHLASSEGPEYERLMRRLGELHALRAELQAGRWPEGELGAAA